jgi:hypothetical protein
MSIRGTAIRVVKIRQAVIAWILASVYWRTNQHHKQRCTAMHGERMIEKAEALRQIRLALRRAALLYHYFGEVLIQEFGEEKGLELISKAVDAYGAHVGRAAREQADKKGLPLSPANFESDLPELAWDNEPVVVEGEKRTRVHFCPLAEELRELGSAKRARLYCCVDQAKMKAYNPEYEYIHLHNIIDGDPFCELVVRPVKKKERSGGNP